MEALRYAHHALTVHNIAASIAFYTNFGFDVKVSTETFAILINGTGFEMCEK